MPHILAKNISIPSSFSQDGFEFEYELVDIDDPTQSIICIKNEGEEIFFRKKSRDKNAIIKCEKINKNISTGTIKSALRAMAKEISNEVISHNLNNDTTRQKTKSQYLKNPSFFVDFKNSFSLEIGFGSGRHILNLAKNNPQNTYVGIEIHTPSIEQVLRQIELYELKNLHILNFDARIFLEILNSNICDGIYLHFPIPWDKKPNRRVWSKNFLYQAMRVLKKDASIELRTDDEGYFLYSLDIALQAQNTQIKINKNIQKDVVSKYEARWQKQNKNIFDLEVTSLWESPNQNLDFDFSFGKISTENIESNKHKKVIKEDYFLHINGVFSNDDFYMIGLSFGDFAQPQNKFILIQKHNKEARYIQGEPLPTIASFKAHQMLIEILNS